MRILVKFILRLFNNDNINISTKNGIACEDTLIGKEHSYLILKDAIIRDDKYIIKVNYLPLKPDVIQHISKIYRSSIICNAGISSLFSARNSLHL